MIDHSLNYHYMVNGNSLSSDAEDVILTDRGAYIEGGQGFYLAPPVISQFGFVFPESFTIIIWIHPTGTTTQTLLKKGSFLEIRLEPSLSEIHATYNGQAGPVVSADPVGNYHLGKWGLISISHSSDSGTQTLKFFYNDTPGTIESFQLTFSDTSSQQLVLGSSLVTSHFNGFIFEVIIYAEIIPDASYSDDSLFKVGTGSCVYPANFYECISLETDPLNNGNGQSCMACPHSCFLDTSCIECHSSCNDFCWLPVDADQCVDMATICNPRSFNSSDLRCEWPCIANCETCPNSSECTSCEQGYDLQPDLSCSVGCPSGYTSVSQTCMSCHSDCASCVGSSQSECLTCSDPSRILNNGSCVCQTNYFSNSGSCTQCDSTCATCDGGGAENCLSCIDPLKVVEDEGCVCKEGYYSDHSICVACHSDCQTCEGPLETQCTSCINPTNRIDNGSCVCEEGFYKDSSGRCEACHSECSSCDGPSVSDCLECSNPETSPENGCPCEIGYFLDDTCKPCPSECASCTNSEECLECSDSKREIVEGECECKEGYCEDEKECLDCDAIPLETEQTTEGMIGAGSVGGSIALGFISMLTLDDPAVIWTITNIAQIICYLAILKLPILSSFYQFLTSFQTFGFLPNYFLYIGDGSYAPVEYQKFGYLKKEYRDTNFLKNSGRYIELIIIVLTAYLIMYLISLMVPKSLKEKIRKITSCWISSVLKIVLMVFLDLCVAGSVAIFTNSSQDDPLSVQICVCVSALFLCTPIVLIICFYFKERIKNKDPSVMKYIGSVYSGLNLESCCSYYYEMFLSIRRLTYAVTLFFYRKEPLVVLISQCCFSIFLAVYIICGRIYKTRTTLAINFLSEILLLLTLAALILICFKGESPIIEAMIMRINVFFILAASVSNLIASGINKYREKKKKKDNATPVINIGPYVNDELFSASRRDIISSYGVEDNRLNCRNFGESNSLFHSSNSIDITGAPLERLMMDSKRISDNTIYVDNAD